MRYVATMASHPPRFKFLLDSLPTITRQTVKPEHIVVYISKEHKKYLRPSIITKLPKKVDFVFLDRDLRPLNKLLPALKEFDIPIITFDDDIYHHSELCERLLVQHDVFPNALIANVGIEVGFKDHKLTPFKTWKSRVSSLGYPSPFLLNASGHGTLFHRNHFVDDVYDVNSFEELSYSRMDAWVHFHSVRNGSYTHVLPNKIDTRKLEISDSQAVALHKENRSKHDKIFAALEERYGNLWDIMHDPSTQDEQSSWVKMKRWISLQKTIDIF
jgi:hypothetical protein